MTNLRYIPDNLLEDVNTVTASTENTTYVTENLYNRRPGKPFKFTTTAGNLVCDFASATTIDSVAIIGHNIDDGATVTLEGNATDSWSSPSLSETISYMPTNTFKVFTSGSYQYWRLVVSGAAATVKIGELVLGVHVELSDNFKWGAEIVQTYKNKTHHTEYGQPWSYHLYNNRQYKIDFVASGAALAELQVLHAAVKGSNRPFVIISNAGVYDVVMFDYQAALVGDVAARLGDGMEALYVTMPDKLAAKRNYTNNNELETVLTEMPLGKEL